MDLNRYVFIVTSSSGRSEVTIEARNIFRARVKLKRFLELTFGDESVMIEAA